MTLLNSVAVFCGSSLGDSEIYRQSAQQIGKVLAEENIRLVYGGAAVGLMGAVADAVLDNGGQVTGVLPTFMAQKEIAHPHLTELVLVETMHQRKTKMSDLADGFIALPGGMGTLEELFEIITWAQLGLHTKPIGIFNADGFYNHLILMIDKMVGAQFVSETNRNRILIDDYPERLLQKMRDYQAPPVTRWLTNSRS